MRQKATVRPGAYTPGLLFMVRTAGFTYVKALLIGKVFNNAWISLEIIGSWHV